MVSISGNIIIQCNECGTYNIYKLDDYLRRGVNLLCGTCETDRVYAFEITSICATHIAKFMQDDYRDAYKKLGVDPELYSFTVMDKVIKYLKNKTTRLQLDTELNQVFNEVEQW